MDIELVKKKAKGYFNSARGSHGWDHTERVYNLCSHIGQKENVDMAVLQVAAILHDIGRQKQDESKGELCHANEGAVIAKELLGKLGFETEKIEKVVHCIKCHRYRGENIPQSKEAQVLFDADKLDSIGAVGIGRAFLFAGEVGAKLHNHKIDVEKTEAYSKEDTAYREFMVKLRKIKDRLVTNEGKRIAEGRHQFMLDFFERMNGEVDGEI